jgi:hypothetical protein
MHLKRMTARDWIFKYLEGLLDMNLDPESVHNFLSKVATGTFGRYLREQGMQN